MKEISVPESKEIMLNVLGDVADFCDKHNIVYYLAYGTLIGAIRHKGFIPWDDDIDIMMPRPDYERFVELYHKKGNLGISSPLVDKECVFIYTKVYDPRTVKYEEGINYDMFSPIGIDIDVFPLDGMPSDSESARYKKDACRNSVMCNLLERAISRPSKPGTIKGKISTALVNPVCRLLGKEFFMKRILRFAKKYSWDDSSLVHVVFPNEDSMNERYDKSLFLEREIVVFEGHEFWAPAGFDSILRMYYGDYMQLPPEEKRVTHHGNKIYWK